MTASFQTLDDLRLTGRRVLLRADLNVPMKDGHITDDTRLRRILPTLQELARAGAKTVILSHLGRPKGEKVEAFSLRPIATALGDLLGEEVAFAPDCIGEVAQKATEALQNGQFLLLENTRFYAGEEKNDPAFTQELARLGEVFVNDAFSAAHRAHASTTGLAALLPSAAGRLMQEELTALSKALEAPEKPLAALIGGSKISTKLDLLRNLVAKVDILVLGGGMANTFLAARGVAIGASLHEADMLEIARTIDAEATSRGCLILLPRDAVVAKDIAEGAAHETLDINAIPADGRIVDVGPLTIKDIKDSLDMSRTLVWNGPLGVFEVNLFDKGTNEVAIAVADLTKRAKLLSVAGGGDTLAALANAGVTAALSYVSTAGGAFLEWMEGKDLPGVVALKKAVPVLKTGKAIL